MIGAPLMEMVWVQNLRSYLKGEFAPSDRWREIFVREFDELVRKKVGEFRGKPAFELNEQEAAMWRSPVDGMYYFVELTPDGKPRIEPVDPRDLRPID